eukprot:TRINITY_DN7137_c0_g1_i3.p4 TRINITY_DN7137_c0_g1~~TRINITY_DN7137_c0_g1_i3.p4  ORF type:complete len:115 (+),score=2.70 TRINITY_DN7137_c0_g1_i3:1543-1887(+)
MRLLIQRHTFTGPEFLLVWYNYMCIYKQFLLAGRAGRAGAHGEVYSLVTPTQIKHFQHLRRQIDPKELKPLDVAENAFDELMPRYQEALHALKGAINVREIGHQAYCWDLNSQR